MCQLCRSYPCNYHCPNYIPPKTSYYCSICQEGIYEGEEYIENDCGEYIHYECPTVREMVEFLGYEVQVMKI